VLSDEGQVLSWGFDGHVQLGHSSIQCQKIPAVIDALADQHVIHVTCGGSSLAAITGKLRHDL
jgi:alpha-tubulin suppressor-like RCC1 family protein